VWETIWSNNTVEIQCSHIRVGNSPLVEIVYQLMSTDDITDEVYYMPISSHEVINIILQANHACSVYSRVS